MHTLVVAEKPSVARDIARVLGAKGRGENSLIGGGYVVTWAARESGRGQNPPGNQRRWL